MQARWHLFFSLIKAIEKLALTSGAGFRKCFYYQKTVCLNEQNHIFLAADAYAHRVILGG
jgi:hypothetical protein